MQAIAEAQTPPGLADGGALASAAVSLAAGDLIALCLCVLMILAILVHTLLTGSPPMPTLPGAGRALFRILPDTPPGRIVELGSGWGTLALALARRFPDRAVTGCELSPLPWAFSKILGWAARRPNLNFRRQNFFKIDLSDAGLVVCYLTPRTMRRVAEKCAAELPRGAYVASNGFALPGWHPVSTRIVGTLIKQRVYLYRKGRRSGSRQGRS